MRVNKNIFGGINAANAARAPLPLACPDIAVRLAEVGRALDDRLRERRAYAIIGGEEKEGEGHVTTSPNHPGASADLTRQE